MVESKIGFTGDDQRWIISWLLLLYGFIIIIINGLICKNWNYRAHNQNDDDDDDDSWNGRRFKCDLCCCCF